MTRRVIAVVPDLFFATRIAATAQATGVTLEQPAIVAAFARCREAPPDLVILELGAGPATMELARALKSDAATHAVPLIGFYSHVDAATREAALAAGVDQVLPRSAFTARLPALVSGTG